MARDSRVLGVFLAGVLLTTPAVAQVATGAPRPTGASQRSDTIVKMIGAPVHPSVATLVRDLTIGTVNGPAEYAFTWIEAFTVGRGGAITVIDRGSSIRGTATVRRYDSTGKFIRTIGRSGQGPGEWTSPRGLVELDDGRLLVLDVPTNVGLRLLVYSPAGNPLTTWGLSGRHMVIGRILDTEAGGAITLHSQLFPPGPMPPLSEVNGPWAVERISPSGAILDTAWLKDLPTMPLPMLQLGTTRSVSQIHAPYLAFPLAVWSPLGYAVTAVTNRYALDLRIPRPEQALPSGSVAPRPLASAWRPGDPVTSLRRAIAPVPVSEAERTDWRAYMTASQRRADAELVEDGRPQPSDRTIPDIPRFKPAISNFLVADDGRIWVSTTTASERYVPPPPLDLAVPRPAWRSPIIYDVLEPDGTYIGQVSVPYGVSLSVIRGDVVWGTTRDDDGVPFVNRYHIVWR